MKLYEYVEVEITSGLFSNGTFEHRIVIDEYAQKGYRYVGYIPTKYSSYGVIKEADLIFEIDDDQN